MGDDRDETVADFKDLTEEQRAKVAGASPLRGTCEPERLRMRRYSGT